MQSLPDGFDETRQPETYGTQSQSQEELEGSLGIGHGPDTETDTRPQSDLIEKDRHTPSRQIGIDLIDTPPRWRKLKMTVVTKMADSLRRDGLLQPIGVRAVPESGRYDLVFGRHWLEAARKLGWETIPAIPFDLADERAYQSITDAENLFRAELKPAERVLALKRWHAHYAEEHPETVGRRVAAAATNRARWGTPGDESGDAEAAETAPPKTFVDHVAEVTGMERKTVERYHYAGKNLTEDQLLVLAGKGVPLDSIKQINKLEPGQIAAATTMIAGGCPHGEAIAEAKLPPGATLEVVGDPDAPRPEEELTDEEWVREYCGDLLEKLRYQAKFVSDAIVYRQMREARTRLRNAAKKPLAQARKRGLMGPYFHLVARFANIDHPKNWLPCGPCGGTGMSGDNSTCGYCHGSAYLIQKESRR